MFTRSDEYSISFLALGGDSIAAINLMDTRSKAGCHLTVSDVVRDKGLAKIATHLHRKTSAELQRTGEALPNTP